MATIPNGTKVTVLEPTAFEVWFVDCSFIAIQTGAATEEYVWDLDAPGAWRDMFAAGASPRAAVAMMWGNLTCH